MPNNNFVNQSIPNIALISVNEIIQCDQCLDDKEMTATSYCLECNEHFCEACCKRHKTLKETRTHQVVNIADKPSYKELVKMSRTYCKVHKNKEINLYCCDCKTTCCILCVVDKHKMHEYTDVGESAEKFKKQLT